MSLDVVLTHMGYVLDKDFVLVKPGAETEIIWLSAQPQPTQSEIDAAAPAALAAYARASIPPVSARQMLVALDEAGLLDSIETYVASQPRVVQITWQRSQEFQRDNPILVVGAQALGLTDEQVDDLFSLAASK